MRFPLLAATLLLLLVRSAPAFGSAVVIWPVDPSIAAGEQATALWLENKGDAPATLQIRPFAWSQPAGDDRLERQDAVVASPPIAVVAPGARQLVRLIRRTPAAAPESAYRLLIDELPPPPATGGAQAVEARLQVQMRYSIPLFVHAGAVAAAPQLSARIATAATGTRALVIRNDGSGHARLTDLRLVAGGGREIVVRAGLAGYVLPGATVSIPLADGQSGSVRVGVNGVERLIGTAA